MIEKCERGECAAYRNPYAGTRYHRHQWLVEISHGSGGGRSYGTVNVSFARECGWTNSDQTGYIVSFDNQMDAEKYADEMRHYYDGSDYA